MVNNNKNLTKKEPTHKKPNWQECEKVTKRVNTLQQAIEQKSFHLKAGKLVNQS